MAKMIPPGLDLLDEKSLWKIYKKCIALLPSSKFNWATTSIVVLVLICDSAYFPLNHHSRLESLRSLAELGLGFGSTILGFLIAGFTIFATLSKPELFRRMYDTTHEPSGLSYLKVNFFAFVEVFCVYILFLVLCLVIKLFCGTGGIAASLITVTETSPIFGYSLSKSWLINTVFILLAGVSYYSLMALKSFVFNTYHAVMTSIVWSFIAQDQDAQKK